MNEKRWFGNKCEELVDIKQVVSTVIDDWCKGQTSDTQTHTYTNLWGRSGVHSGGGDDSGGFTHSGAGELLSGEFGQYVSTLWPAHTHK